MAVLAIAGMGGNNNSQSGSSTATSSSTQSAAPKPTPKKDVKLTGITASYSGNVKDGEQVTDQTSGITVTAKYDDGTTKNVTGWKIQNPGAVNINAPTEFTIEYEGQTAKVSIQAQPPVEYQNALNKAKSYSDMMHMSKKYIRPIDQRVRGAVPRRSRAIRRGPPASRLQRKRIGQSQVLPRNNVHVLGRDLRPACVLVWRTVYPRGSPVRHRQSQQISKSPAGEPTSVGRRRRKVASSAISSSLIYIECACHALSQADPGALTRLANPAAEYPERLFHAKSNACRALPPVHAGSPYGAFAFLPPCRQHCGRRFGCCHYLTGYSPYGR